MEKCDFNLAADIAADCNSMSVKGLDNTGVIINFDDIDREASAFDATNKSILNSLILNSGKKAYRCYVPGKTPFTGTNKALVVLNEGPDVTTDIIDKLANGRFVVILGNKTPGTGGKATYEVYGYETGLTAAEISNDKYSEETNGGYAVSLEETGGNKSGIFLFAESLKATKTMLDSLVAGS